MKAMSAQLLLSRSPRSPKNSPISTSSSTTADASDTRLGHPVNELDDSCEERRSNLASQGAESGEEVPQSNSLWGLSKRNGAVKLKSLAFSRKRRGSGTVPARSYKQKSRVLHVPVDNKDLQKLYQRPQFTLQDFIVGFAASVGVVERSLLPAFTDCGLQKVLEEHCEPNSSQLSTQLLQLPDDLPEVCKRVPPKQVLIEMAAVVREQLYKVVHHGTCFSLLLHPQERLQNIVMSVFVCICLFVCLRGYLERHVRFIPNLLCMLPMARSALLRQGDEITSGMGQFWGFLPH